jgi:hypothetical protein
MDFTLGVLLKSKSFGLFANAIGEYCTVSTFYVKNTKKIQVIFAKPGEIAKRPAINTISENKVKKLLINEGFQLVEK